MNEIEFLKELKNKGVDIIRALPSGYDYTISGKTLTLKLSEKGIHDNMQDNSAAFESWAFVLKHYCSAFVNDVVIDWEDTEKESEHFNRFIYRLTRFVQSYDWVTSGKHIPPMPSIICSSAPSNKTITKEESSIGSEDWYECDFVERNTANYDIIDHQLHVGLFDGKASDYSPFTPARNSQIDIWALKGEEFSVFELKIPGNKPIGIISELMFYTNVICDWIHHSILIDENKAKDAINNKLRGFDKFYEIYNGTRNVSKIRAVFLAENFHSLFNEEILKLINDSVRLKRFNITYEIARP